MGEHVSYQGKDLGKFHFDNNGKIFFAANSLDSLVALFRLNPQDKVTVEFMGEMSYEQFSEGYLKRFSGFYPTDEEWLFRNHPGRTLAEVERIEEKRK